MFSEKPNTQGVSLLDLPPEIRVNIYSHLFEDNYFELRGGDDGYQRDFKCESSILRCCRLTYLEAKPVFQDSLKVRLSGELLPEFIISPGHNASYFGPEAGFITAHIPDTILHNVTEVESYVRYSAYPKMLNAFRNLKVLHIKEAAYPNICQQEYLSSLLRNCIPFQSNGDLERFDAGQFDEDVVHAQMKQFDEGSGYRYNRLIFMGRDGPIEHNFRILVTTRGFMYAPKLDDVPANGPNVVERVITYDYDTLEIKDRKSVCKELVKGETLLKKLMAF